MKTNMTSEFSRRSFLKFSLTGAAAAVALPTIVPSSVLGAASPNNLINIGQIGCGRIAKDMDLPGILKHTNVARVTAVCDVDSIRLANAKKQVETSYTKRLGSDKSVAVKTYGDYHEMLKDKSIDAVAISTPEHWHAEPIIAAALAGKDVYVQKPLTMTLTEGRMVSDVLRAQKRAFQIGSQQRSGEQFRFACELVRNGRIGKVRTVEIGLPIDPAGENEPEMPVPANLNYDMWLGCTPVVPYTEKRVHPQKDYSRPGWLRIETYCLGMITGWGSHHLDIAHWGMDTELTGPLEIQAKAEFPKSGIWTVHGKYHIEMAYANGATMIIDDTFTNGIKFIGEKGWVFVSRGGGKATASDPTSTEGKELAASDQKILDAKIQPNELHLYKSTDHHLNWLESIKTRKPAVTSPEVAHRSTSACILGWIGMKLGRKLKWDPAKEEFPGDAEANALLSRLERAPYGTTRLMKRA